MQSMDHLDEIFYARIGGFLDEFDDLVSLRYRHLLGGNTSIAHVFSHKLTNGIIILAMWSVVTVSMAQPLLPTPAV